MGTFVTAMRLLMIALIAAALVATLTDTSGLVPDSMVNIASYYTFQINVVCAAVLVALTWHRLGRTEPHPWVEWGRAFTAVNLMVVGILYWTVIFPLGTEHGPQMTWVMIITHIITPLYLGVEYLVVGNRRPLPLSGWWIIAGYAMVWNVATVIRSMDGDFIPYDHLDPGQRPWASIVSTLALHSVLLIALTVVGLRWRSWRMVPEPASASAHVLGTGARADGQAAFGAPTRVDGLAGVGASGEVGDQRANAGLTGASTTETRWADVASAPATVAARRWVNSSRASG